MAKMINVYYGVSNDAPQNIDNLQCIQVTSSELLKNGLKLNFTTDDQYTVIALEKDCGLDLSDITQSGFSLEKINVKNNNFNIYYGEERSTDTATVICKFK